MTHPTVEPQALALSGLAHRCAQETERFFNREPYDPGYCYELFRRAIVSGDQRAHERLYAQYQALVAGWIERHPSYHATGEEVQYFVNRAFEKFWRALLPAKFSRFSDLKSLLAYLKMCTHSVLIDYSRAKQLAQIDEEPSDHDIATKMERDIDPEENAIRRAERADFWRYIDDRIGGEKERAVIYGSFVLAMKPAELQTQYAHLFSDVKDVYRTKQNVIERLRRDETLLALIGAQA